MIPTAVKGHMPFLSTPPRRNYDTNGIVKPKTTQLPQENGLKSKSPLALNGSSDHAPTLLNGKARPPTTLSPTNGHQLSPVCSSSLKARSPISDRSQQQLSPTFAALGLDSPNGCLHLSQAKRDDILHKDHYWRDFLKAVFKIKGSKKSTDTRKALDSSSDVNENHVGHQSTTKPIPVKHPGPHKRVKHFSKSKLSKTSSKSKSDVPLQRSHSMNATHKNLARLEAILEEDLDVESSTERINSLCSGSAPSTINRIRPISEHLERKALIKYLRESPNSTMVPLWTDSESSNESLHEPDQINSLD